MVISGSRQRPHVTNSHRVAAANMLTRDAARPICCYLPRAQGGAAPSIFVHAFSSNTWLVLVIFLVLITLAIAISVHVETRVILQAAAATEEEDEEGEGEGEDGEERSEQTAEAEPASADRPPRAADDQDDDQDQLTEHWEGSEILLVTVGAVCQQGSPRDPDSLAARLVFLTLFMMAVLCYVAFSAAVTSLVSSERSPSTLPLQELLRRRDAAPVLEDSPYFQRTLAASAPGARLLPLSRGLKSLLSGSATVLCADTGRLQLQVRQLGRMGLWCQLQTTAFTLPLAPEPLRQKNDTSWRGGLRSLEAGLWTRERRGRILPDVKGLCAEESRGSVIPVSLGDVWLAPALLGAGVIASLVILAAEGVRSWSTERLKEWRAMRILPFTL